MVLGKSSQTLSVRTVLYSVSCITCVSENLLQRLKTHFLGEQLAYLFPGECSVTVSDGRTVKVRKQTRRRKVSIHTLLGSVAINLSSVVITGTDDDLALSAKTLRQKLYIDAAKSLRRKPLHVGMLVLLECRRHRETQ